ncbi:MAG: aspartate/glutamate racemase family protein [Sedimentisphaerales bacterium]|nr:aspartate/glutamate racemase family protein [Sedimentisphaerales bacterium]
MKEKTVGILGGMGPESTAELFSKIIRATPAEKDQDHLRIIIDNNTKIPDRTDSILKGEKVKILECIKESLSKLENYGVEIIAIPCNTIHFYWDDIISFTNVSIINMIQEVSLFINKNYSNIGKVGLMATTGTIVGQIYQKYIQKDIVVPNNENQKKVMDAIYGKSGIKAGKKGKDILKKFNDVSIFLKKSGAELIISGCTEISLVLNEEIVGLPIIDPLEVLAKSIVRKAIQK